jgi:hypothetical protein
LTQDEQRSYDFYLRETAQTCSVFSRRHFWMVLVPQAALAHPAVKHSLLSFGIIYEMVMFPDRAAELDDGRLLFHYNAAIRAITQGHPTTDIVLITSVMFFFIDFLRRDGGPAASHHMEAAFNILEEFKASESHASAPYRETITEHIEPLVYAFWAWASYSQDPLNRPGPLSTAEVALSTGVGSPSLATAQVRDIVRSLFRFGRNPSPTAEIAAGLDQLRAQCLQSHGMLSSYRVMQNGQHFSGRMFLVHHGLALTLLREVKEHLKIPETLYDDGILALYAYMIDHVEMHLSETQATVEAPGCDPWKDLGYIAPLFATAVRSPDDDLATRALKILRQLDVTEGVWNSRLAADAAEALAQAQFQEAVGFDLSSLCFERTPQGLRMYVEGQEVACNSHLQLPVAELESMDLVSSPPLSISAGFANESHVQDAILSVVQCYGYQFDSSG